MGAVGGDGRAEAAVVRQGESLAVNGGFVSVENKGLHGAGIAVMPKRTLAREGKQMLREHCRTGGHGRGRHVFVGAVALGAVDFFGAVALGASTF